MKIKLSKRLASWKVFFRLQSSLSKTRKLRTCSKITWPHLGLIRNEGNFPWSLDLLLRFGSSQNEEVKDKFKTEMQFFARALN